MSVFDRLARGAALLATVTLMAAAPVEAKVGGGMSSGSRGGRTFSPPPSTATAPGSAQPMQRTEMPSTARPNVGAPAAPGRRFGFGTGMMAGLLGAGLLGALFGHGFFGGLSGLASMFGFLLQVALVVGAGWLLLRLFRRRSEPAFAGLGGAATGSPAGPTAYARSSPAGLGGSATGVSVAITEADYAAFEASLKNIQRAYGAEDVAALTHLATPEMVRYLSSDLENNRSRGLRNDVSDAMLLQGDLAEAWREGSVEYATVAMRFSLVDVMVDRASGRLVSGDRSRPEVSTELWTFRRENGGAWILSAIQQTA